MFTRHDMKISKPEVVIVASVVVFPLLFDWIPFTTNSYGQFAAWCWIHSLERNCTTNSAGRWEQICLVYVPFGVVSFVILVLFVASLCQLGYGIKNAKVRLIQVGTADYLLVLTFFIFMSCIYAIGQIANTSTLSNRHFIFWIYSAVTFPLAGTCPTLALLVAIHLPISATCIYYKRHQYQEINSQAHEDEPNTVNRSDTVNIPSHTTWDSPHSTPF